jgi:Carboxypeptidase regulatory-like domain
VEKEVLVQSEFHILNHDGRHPERSRLSGGAKDLARTQAEKQPPSTHPAPTCLLLLMITLCLLGVCRAASAQVANAPQAANTTSGYRVAGTVFSKTDGHVLARARVVLRDVKNPQNFGTRITAEDGKFEFNGIPAGKYSLGGSKKGFISGNYDQHDFFSTAIVTGAGLDTENLVLKLAPGAVISGKVLDEAGDPIRHAMVHLYYDDHRDGVDRIQGNRTAMTDDLGVYEMTPLMPGTYFLSATATPWYAVHPHTEPANARRASTDVSATDFDRSLDVAYTTTYYADVPDADSATPIPVRGGERLQVDIHLNPVQALRLIFHVPSDGKNGYIFPRLEQPAFEGSTSVQTSGGRMISPGVLEITGIPAGRYDIRIQGAGAGVQINGVDLSKDGEEIDTAAGEALSTVKVSAQIPGEPTLPPQLAIGLRAKGRMLAGWKRLDPKGEAELDQIPAGRYEVLVWGARKPYSIAHVSAEGAEVSGHILVVKPGSSPSFSVTLTTGTTELQGTAKLAGKPFAGAMVVLVPKDPEGQPDLFRRDQTDLDGTFDMRNVIPGSYTILAIETGWELDWAQPAVIAAYAKHGRKIEVGNQTGPLMNLTESIEVQSK